eukprot:TRINITY_DN191_c1_g4_i1.p1 TRINITY_DN191_c1_g4~~TRINITY_DN191_c1_g4_i1.p1  ORF type:complete len:295 (+),score=58.26 TRINITY_DN191_c1_g4_i1:76-960(+)
MMINFKRNVLVCLLVIVCTVNGQMQDPITEIAEGNTASTINGSANSGNFNAFQGITNFDVQLVNDASHNQAESISGDARSGNSLFFAGGENGFIEGSDFVNINSAVENKDVSQTNTANSGQQSVFNAIRDDSNVVQETETKGNEATVSGVFGSGNPAAISGVDTQAKEVTDSTFSNVATSSENSAVNTFTGRAVSGSSTNIGQAENSNITFENENTDNFALSSNGVAISGAQNNIASLTDSILNTESTSIQNTAISQGGDGVAGVQNNFGTISGGVASTEDIATDNIAVARLWV